MLGNYCYVHGHYAKMVYACCKCGATAHSGGCAHDSSNWTWVCRISLYKAKKGAKK